MVLFPGCENERVRLAVTGNRNKGVCEHERAERQDPSVECAVEAE